MRLFWRVHAALRPGGRFLLEPQPWSSYRKNRNVSEETKRNFQTIQLRPPHDRSGSDGGGIAEVFRRILVERVGFASCEELAVERHAGESAGFAERPLLLFTKACRRVNNSANAWR